MGVTHLLLFFVSLVVAVLRGFPSRPRRQISAGSRSSLDRGGKRAVASDAEVPTASRNISGKRERKGQLEAAHDSEEDPQRSFREEELRFSLQDKRETICHYIYIYTCMIIYIIMTVCVIITV